MHAYHYQWGSNSTSSCSFCSSTTACNLHSISLVLYSGMVNCLTSLSTLTLPLPSTQYFLKLTNRLSVSLTSPTERASPCAQFHPTIYFRLNMVSAWWKRTALVGLLAFWPSRYVPWPLPQQFRYYFDLTISWIATPMRMFPELLMTRLWNHDPGPDYDRGSEDSAASLQPLEWDLVAVRKLAERAMQGCFRVREKLSTASPVVLGMEEPSYRLNSLPPSPTFPPISELDNGLLPFPSTILSISLIFLPSSLTLLLHCPNNPLTTPTTLPTCTPATPSSPLNSASTNSTRSLNC